MGWEGGCEAVLCSSERDIKRTKSYNVRTLATHFRRQVSRGRATAQQWWPNRRLSRDGNFISWVSTKDVTLERTRLLIPPPLTKKKIKGVKRKYTAPRSWRWASQIKTCMKMQFKRSHEISCAGWLLWNSTRRTPSVSLVFHSWIFTSMLPICAYDLRVLSEVDAAIYYVTTL